MPQPRRVFPPVYLLAAILTMVALHRWLPVRGFGSGSGRAIGITLIGIGMAMLLWSAFAFHRTGTTIKPFETSSALVTSGLYRISRNPIYLGMAIMLLGMATGLGSLTPWLIVPLFVLVIDRIFIRAEEAMLRERFGEAFDTYCQHTRRWL